MSQIWASLEVPILSMAFMIACRLSIIRWMSLGNQLQGVRLVDEGLRARFKAAYPDVEVQPASPPRASAMEVDAGAAPIRSPFSVTEPKSSATQFTDSAALGAAYAASEDKPMPSDVDMVN